MNPLLDRILLLVCEVERKIDWLLPNFFGGSLFIVGKKGSLD